MNYVCLVYCHGAVQGITACDSFGAKAALARFFEEPELPSREECSVSGPHLVDDLGKLNWLEGVVDEDLEPVNVRVLEGDFDLDDFPLA